MPEEINSSVFIPSTQQLEHIHKDLFLIDIQGQTTYHKWKDVWDDNLIFKSTVQPHSNFSFRTVKISVPVYHKFRITNSVYPYGFIYGIDIKTGNTIICQLGINMEFIN